MRIQPAPVVLALSMLVAILAGPVACASSGEPAGERAPRSQPNLLTEEQIRATNLHSAYDVVRSLRPAWLRQRPLSVSNPEGAQVAVYVDGARVTGGIETLRQFRADNVLRMEYMSPSDATTRFGTGHMGGAILVITRRG